MFINQLFENAYSDGVSDGIRGRANPRASSIYGPGTDEYHKGYADGLKQGEEQRQARVDQGRADRDPYEKMSTAELNHLLADIQQRTQERHAIYSKLRGSDYSFDPKRHRPANDAELKAQNAADNKAWNAIHQVLGQRKRQGMGEAGSPAQQAAIAIAMKKAHKKPKTEGVDEEKQRLDPKCWDGYKKQGTKIKGGVRVNNCVPESAEGVAESSDRDPGALASRAHIASQERKHQAWDEKQKQLEKEFYANHPELDNRHKSVDNLVKEFNEMLSRISK